MGACALMTATAALADDKSTPYATVGDWSISARTEKTICLMDRSFAFEGGESEALLILYDAAGENLSFTWASLSPNHVPAGRRVDLELAFTKKPGSTNVWRKRPFQYLAYEKTHYFTHVFKGPELSKKVLDELGRDKSVALFHDGALLMAVPLDAGAAITSLRECAMKTAQSSARPPAQARPAAP